MTTMMEEIQESTVVEDVDEDDEDGHIACICSPRVSLCGAFLTQPLIGTYGPDDDHMCQECVDLVDDPCPRCGDL